MAGEGENHGSIINFCFEPEDKRQEHGVYQEGSLILAFVETGPQPSRTDSHEKMLPLEH